MSTLLRFFLPFVLALPVTAQSGPNPSAQGSETRASVGHYNLSKKGVAIDGYDPVTYFPEGGSQPKKGSADLSLVWRGVTYYFASSGHRELFQANAPRFEPAYGGWCAYAMAQAEKVEVDPESYLVHGGRLFLFYKSFFNDTRKKWLGEELEFSLAADRNWLKVAKEKSPRNVLAYALGEQDLALEGYDPISYHMGEGQEPIAGVKEFALRHEGVLYHFASEANRERFRAAPESFEPAFGGWSALAAATGRWVKPDPRDYRIEQGRLLLFHRENNADQRSQWSTDSNAMKRAEEAWRKRIGG